MTFGQGSGVVGNLVREVLLAPLLTSRRASNPMSETFCRP